MSSKPLSDYQAGDSLPDLVMEPLTRHTLALYCGGSGDHNAIHTDIDYARKAGLDDVIGHGMLSMAYLARVLTAFAPQEAIRMLNARFTGMARIGDAIVCSGMVARREREAGEDVLHLSLRAAVGERDIILGEAILAATGAPGRPDQPSPQTTP